MHWATWQLTPEEVRLALGRLPSRLLLTSSLSVLLFLQMTEPPKRLRRGCDVYGITADEFGVTDFGETVRIKVSRGSSA